MSEGGSARGPDRSGWWLGLVLAAYLALAYGSTIGLPFLGDDYVFFDRVLRERFLDLASRANTDFGWWRPWSRDLHFWLLAHVAGIHPPAFHLVGFALWLAAHLLFFALLARAAPPPVPALATLGSAALSLWAAPLLWASGDQDLWMLVWGLVGLNLYARGASLAAAAALAPALLSKETAAVFPLLCAGYSWWIERAGWRGVARRGLPLWLVVAAWAAVHPTLRAHLLEPAKFLAGQPPRLGPGELILRTVLSFASLERWPLPTEVRVVDVALALASAAVLALGAWLATSRSAPASPPTSRARLAGFALVWALAGALPVAAPGLGWQAYYACVGAMGAWFLIALGLARRPRLAVPLLAALALLRSASAHTPTWSWSSEWYQRRAGVILGAIQREMLWQHPRLAPHTRVYFGRIPNNIGLVAGQSPAIRVWYRDPTLEAGFFSSYRPRAPGAPAGEDLFFRFDTVRTLVEVRAGPENATIGLRADPDWVADHEGLAVRFALNGDPARAAAEFEKVARAASRLPDLAWAAQCLAQAGDSSGAGRRFEEVARRLGVTRARAESLAERWSPATTVTGADAGP